MRDIKLDDKSMERLLRIAQSYNDIDLPHFEDNVRKQYGKEQEEASSYIVKDNESSFSANVMNRFNGSTFAIRGATVRPGFGDSGATSEREIARNSPSKEDEFEVYNPDTIPLSTYRKMSRDPTIALGLYILKGWISGLKYNIRTSDPVIKNVVTYVLDNVWKSLIRDMLTGGFVNGFAFAEKVWMREEVILDDHTAKGEDETVYQGKIVGLKKIKALDPDQRFKFFKNEQDEISRVVQRQRSGDVEIPRDKLVWFALDQEYSSLFGKSRLKQIYEVWYYGKIVFQHMLKHLERLGSPHLEIKYPKGASTFSDGTTKDNQELALELGEMLQSIGMIAHPSETDERGNEKWSFKFAQEKNGGVDNYLSVRKELDKLKFFGIGVPDMLTGDNNYSNIDALTDVLVVNLEDVVSQIEEIIQKDVVNQIVEYNFGPEYKSKVKLRIDRSSLNRRRVWKDVMDTMLRLGGSMKGYRLNSVPDIKAMGDDMGMPFTSFTEVFGEDERASMDSGETPLEEDERDRKSNQEDRQGQRESDEDRPTSKKDITDE